jgi:hypothetical protein
MGSLIAPGDFGDCQNQWNINSRAGRKAYGFGQQQRYG